MLPPGLQCQVPPRQKLVGERCLQRPTASPALWALEFAGEVFAKMSTNVMLPQLCQPNAEWDAVWFLLAFSSCLHSFCGPWKYQAWALHPDKSDLSVALDRIAIWHYSQSFNPPIVPQESSLWPKRTDHGQGGTWALPETHHSRIEISHLTWHYTYEDSLCTMWS